MSEAKSFILCTSSFFSVWSNLNVRLVHITVEKEQSHNVVLPLNKT